MPTRNDGRPLPEVGNYYLLLTGAWIVGFAAGICDTVALVGFHRAPEDRADYPWPSFVVAAVVLDLLWYLLAWKSVRIGGQALRTRSQQEIQFELAWEPVRVAYFGKKRMSTPLALIPVLLTLPALFAGMPTDGDPANGDTTILTAAQHDAGIGAMITGMVLPIVILVYAKLTGRYLTWLAVLAWLPWAWFAQEGAESAAEISGISGLAGIVVALVANIVFARWRAARGHGVGSMLRQR